MKKPYYTQEQREFIRFCRSAKSDFMMLHLETMKFRRELEKSWKRSKFYRHIFMPSYLYNVYKQPDTESKLHKHFVSNNEVDKQHPYK